ncbi:MAG: PLP-dependent aminotransferase family protein, partial [Pseudomonadota bacterium]
MLDDMGPECLSTLQARFAAHSGGKTRRLYLAFYDLLAQGHLTVGSRLPASRQLAPTLGVGRNTVTATYQQLIDEGLLYTAQRGGTRVRAPAGGGPERLNHRASSSPVGQAPGVSRRGRARAIQPRPISLCPGEPDSTLFPRVAWSRALAAAARSDNMHLGYRYDMGERHLREAIARYLARWRSLVVDPDCILITASTRQSLALAGSLYADAGDLAWVESPGYSGASDAWRLLGLQLRPVSVDAQGLVCPDDFHEAKLLYTTPCFQYPFGHGLAPARRLQLLERAAEAGTVVFEDDYDSEFRYS